MHMGADQGLDVGVTPSSSGAEMAPVGGFDRIRTTFAYVYRGMCTTLKEPIDS